MSEEEKDKLEDIEEPLEEEVLEEEEILEEEEGQEIADLPDSPIQNAPVPKPVEEHVKIATDGKPFNELSNLEKIKFASAQNGVEILEPKSSCKHCHGTGVVSIRTIEDPTYGMTSGAEGTSGLIEELPNPCRCIFKKEDRHKMFTGKVPITTKMMRLQEKRMQKIATKNSPKVMSNQLRRAEKIARKKKARRKLKKKHNKR